MSTLAIPVRFTSKSDSSAPPFAPRQSDPVSKWVCENDYMLGLAFAAEADDAAEFASGTASIQMETWPSE